MTEYEINETLSPSGTVNLRKTSTKAVNESLSGDFENDLFALLITHLRALTFRQRRRTESSKRSGQSKNVVIEQRPKDKDGDIQHHNLSIRRFSRRKNFSWAGFSIDKVWQAVICQEFVNKAFVCCFVIFWRRKNRRQRSTLLRSKPGEHKY